MDFTNLCNVLAACMSTDQSQRKSAEEVLKQHETVKGQIVHLLRVAAEGQVDAAVRQVAAISFKNLVKKCWEAPGEGSYQIPDDDKQIVRDNLLESLIRAPHMVQLQLGEVFKTIVYADFPEQWPTLLPALFPNLVSQEEGRLQGGLYALRIVTRKYEFRDDEGRSPLNTIVNTAFPVLLHIFQQMLAAPTPTAQVAESIKLVCKIFWSCTYMEIPDILLQQEHFVGWMQCLLTFITRPVPSSDATDFSSPWWKAKKWSMHISYRLFSRYSVKKHCKEGNDSAFSEMFVRDCKVTFLDAHMQLVGWVASGTQMSPRVINLIFQFLSHALEIKDMYKHAKDHWDGILHNVAFPMMCFSKEDAALWEEDPHEYIRKGYDILEDMYSPKTAVANFAHELCRKKKCHLDAFMMLIVQVLNSYQQKVTAGGVTEADAWRMDGAMLAVGVMVDLLKNKPPYKQQLGPMMLNCVVPCFKSPCGHLRAKASWLCGVFSDTEFMDGAGQGPTYTLLFQHVVGCLADPELPVRVDAVVAIRHFTEEVQDLSILRPVLPALLTSIFQLMSEVDNEDLVFTLETIVQKFDEEIAPFALEMTQQLSAAFWKYVNLSEEDEDDDDIGSLAAYGCIKALNTLLDSVRSLPELYPPLEELLFPIMHKMISNDGQDLFDEVLEMLAFFTFYSPSISERMWSLWPSIHSVLVDWGIDYWENILVPLDNMISRDTNRFLGSQNPDYLASVYQMVQHSLTGDFEESSITSAPKLLEIVLQVCRGRVDHYVAPFLQLTLSKLSSVKSRTLKDTLLLVVANCLYYNATLTLGALAAQGALQSLFGLWFGMIFSNKKSGQAKHFRRMHDKKVCVLGLVSVLVAPEEALAPEIKAGLPQILSGIVKLLVQLKEQQDEAAKEVDEDEDEDGDDEDWGNDNDDDDVDDVDDAKDEAYLKRLAKIAARATGDATEADDDDDDTDDEWTDDEEVETPIDPVDPFVLFADSLMALQAQNPARHQGLLAGVDAAGQATLGGIVQFAEQQRQEAATKAAAKAQ